MASSTISCGHNMFSYIGHLKSRGGNQGILLPGKVSYIDTTGYKTTNSENHDYSLVLSYNTVVAESMNNSLV